VIPDVAHWNNHNRAARGLLTDVESFGYWSGYMDATDYDPPLWDLIEAVEGPESMLQDVAMLAALNVD